MSSDQPDAPETPAAPESQSGANGEDTQLKPLFYHDPAPVTAGTHGDFKIQGERDFSFARDTNAIPLTTPEFVLAQRHYPIVFVGAELVPTAALGIRPDQNLFIGDDGTWERRCYVPAYARRYPFILLGKEDDERLQLGIDNASKSATADARALFEGEKETKTVTDALDLCQQFHGAYQATAMFSSWLKNSGLMEDRTLELEFPNEEKISVGSFSSVSEDKLRELPDDKILELRQKGWLSAIYFHIASLNNWDLLMDRLPEAQQSKAS